MHLVLYFFNRRELENVQQKIVKLYMKTSTKTEKEIKNKAIKQNQKNQIQKYWYRRKPKFSCLPTTTGTPK